jgi:hypothetical protein
LREKVDTGFSQQQCGHKDFALQQKWRLPMRAAEGTTMHIHTERPNRRPKLYLPLALMERPAEARTRAKAPFPLDPDQLRRTVAEMIG